MKKHSIVTAINFIQGIKTLVEEHVKEHPKAVYNMVEYRNCVLGFHKFNNEFWLDKEVEVLEEIFGIPRGVFYYRSELGICAWFDNPNLYSPYEWVAIRLFTRHIGGLNDDGCISAVDWLVKADYAINKLNDLLKANESHEERVGIKS